MVKVALCSPLPPWRVPAASLAVDLLPGLRAGGAEVFVENPYLVQPDLVPAGALFPIGDLSHRLATGEVDVPIYLIGSQVHHVHQLPYLARHPGIIVFTEADLDTLRGPASEGAAGNGEGVGLMLPEFGAQTGPLACVLASLAAKIVARDGNVAEQLRRVLGPDLEVHDLENAQDSAELLSELADSVAKAQLRPRPSAIQWPSVVAVVVSYNSKAIISPCLQSLSDQDYPDLEIVVVDNASADGTAQLIREEFPEVRVIEAGANLGFAAGNNLGFRSSEAKYFVLLNQDAIAHRNWVTELVRAAEADTKVGAVAAKMLMDRCPTLLNSTGTEMNQGGWAWDRQVGEKDEDPSPVPVEVFGGCGGALLLSRAAMQDVGGFDEKYFMYFEDTDLCWRFLLSGYHNYYAPLATVRHDFHGDTGASPGREYRRHFMSERNRIQTLIKNNDSQTLKRVLPEVYRHDRRRLASLSEQIRATEDNDHLVGIAKMIRRAWRWNICHLPSLWWRRRRVQRLRRVSAEQTEHLLLPGMYEGGHQGDVMIFHDRFSAAPKQEIVVADSDRDCLGSGWHGIEHPAGSPDPYRWCRGRAWFYLQPQEGEDSVVIKLASPIERHGLKLFAEDREVLSTTVEPEVAEVSAKIPTDIGRGRLVEFRIECDWMRPIDRDMGPDRRELGIIVFSLRVE